METRLILSANPYGSSSDQSTLYKGLKLKAAMPKSYDQIEGSTKGYAEFSCHSATHDILVVNGQSLLVL